MVEEGGSWKMGFYQVYLVSGTLPDCMRGME
jgi:hypothetical protein